VRSQPVEFLDEFTEDDLRYARLYYDSWKTDGANWFQERFREAVAWIEWNAKMIQKKYRGLTRVPQLEQEVKIVSEESGISSGAVYEES